MADLRAIMNILHTPTKRGVLIPSIPLEKIVRMSIFSRRDSNCSARDGVVAEGISEHGTKITKTRKRFPVMLVIGLCQIVLTK